MKTFKLTRKVQIILATIFVIVVAVIIVGVLSNDGTMAATKSCGCGGTMYCYNMSTGTHQWECDTCTGTFSESCSGGSWKYKSGTSVHQKFCWACGFFYLQEACYDNNGDGVCDAKCGNTSMHSKSSTVKEYIITETTHTPVYTCIQEGCTETYEGEEEAHTGATHANGGECTVEGCGYQYEKHGQSTTVKEYKTTPTGHIPVYACTQEGCTETYEGEEEAHTGATHANGGECTVDGCGYQYEKHGQSTTVKEYKTTPTGHIPVYACTQEGCTETYEGEEEVHDYGAYVDNGDGTHSATCTDCKYTKTENHNYENGTCTECGEKETQEEPEEIEITSEEYELDETYISKVQAETTVSELKANLETNATEVNIYNRNNELISDTDKIGTGMKVELKNGDNTKTFTVVVKGDTDGDGAAGMLDITIINKYRLNKNTLDEAYLKAGDVTGDGKVDFYDIIKINKFRLHKITEL